MDHFLHEECFYCGMEMVGYGRDAPTPSADDDEEWQRLAFFHADDCEWIATRAHRQPETNDE
jgi:hypothetical protein